MLRSCLVWKLFVVVVLIAGASTDMSAQSPIPSNTSSAGSDRPIDQGNEPQQSSSGQAPQSQAPPAPSREAAIEREQAAKVPDLHPYTPTGAERVFQRIDRYVAGSAPRWHPFFESAYRGGGFTLGAGRATYVSAYNYIDVRGSYSIKGYKRAELEFVAPRMFKRRGQLSVLGGWREAPQVGFYGIGMETSKDDRTNYLFQQPYGSALLTLFPTRRILMLRGGVEFSRWSQEPGKGSFPSVDEVYTPATLPGLGAEIDYLHSQATVGLDSRTSPGYTRRGGFLGATLHDYNDRDKAFGFQIAEYEGIAHLPILRETWVLSFHGLVQTAVDKDGQQIPFFMLPSVGGGSSLRGYTSWRFRDRNSILVQAEWRIMINRYLDLAFFYDAGKVTSRTSDLDLNDLKDDFGIGVRFHGPFATPLRVEVARSRESKLSFIFSAGPSF
jgi:hypothetical protein